MKTAAPNAPRPKHELFGKRAAHARYSAVDLRGSPGLLPNRSVGVSPMPTIAVLPRMLMMGIPLFVLREIFQRRQSVKQSGNIHAPQNHVDGARAV